MDVLHVWLSLLTYPEDTHCLNVQSFFINFAYVVAAKNDAAFIFIMTKIYPSIKIGANLNVFCAFA
jgi:hypothetical protein